MKVSSFIFFSFLVASPAWSAQQSSRVSLESESFLKSIRLIPQVQYHSLNARVASDTSETKMETEAMGSFGAGIEGQYKFSEIGKAVATLRVDQVRYKVHHDLDGVRLASFNEDMVLTTLGIGASATPLERWKSLDFNVIWNIHLPVSHNTEVTECAGICEEDSELNPLSSSLSFGLRYRFENRVVADLSFWNGLSNLYQDSEADLRLQGLSLGLGYLF